MIIKSVFENKKKIPNKYGLRFENKNPPLEISGIPKGTKTLAVIVDDPDAPRGDWVHWIIFNIQVLSDKLIIKENTSSDQQGINDFGNTKYDGPAPPSGTHRYSFKAYALNSSLNLIKPTKQQLDESMQGKVLAKAELTGLFSRE
jgi:Raf kinase inhibitor-like YbhB/YbcL family protein